MLFCGCGLFVFMSIEVTKFRDLVEDLFRTSALSCDSDQCSTSPSPPHAGQDEYVPMRILRACVQMWRATTSSPNPSRCHTFNSSRVGHVRKPQSRPESKSNRISPLVNSNCHLRISDEREHSFRFIVSTCFALS